MGAQPEEADRLLAMAGGQGEKLSGMGAPGRQRFAVRVLGWTEWRGEGMEGRMREAVERLIGLAGEEVGVKAMSVEGRRVAVEALSSILSSQADCEPLGESWPATTTFVQGANNA